MQVLVTGANGFIGRHPCRRLALDGYAVRALLRPGADATALASMTGVTIILGDVLAPESLALACRGIDGVVHLAGAVTAGRDRTYGRINVDGTRNLATAAREAGVSRFVFISSLAAQGPSPRGQPHRLAQGEAPSNEYGRSKLAAERALVEEGLAGITSVLRPAIVYGPDSANFAVLARALRSRILPVIAGLELSFCHVDDLVELIVRALSSPSPILGTYFVSDGQPQPMERVVDLLEALLSTRTPVRLSLPPRLLSWLEPLSARLADSTGLGAMIPRWLGELRATGWTCSPEETTAAFGYAPIHALQTSLGPVVDWYREHGLLEPGSGGHRRVGSQGKTPST